MKKILKIGIVLYFACAFPLLFFVSDFFILKPSSEIYGFIPQDADIIIELNSKNFIKEIAYQRIYNEDYFLRKMPSTEDESLIKDAPLNTGINFFSQILIFRENWAKEEVWYSILKIDNSEHFELYLESKQLDFEIAYADGYAIVQLNSSNNQSELKNHLENIANKKIKSFDSKIDLSQVFHSSNEMNIYLSPKNSKHIIDGFLYLNFFNDHIVINGNFTPISQNESIPFIAYSEEKGKALSLRSSLNLFNSIYIFNDQKLENLPEYSQLSMDFDGTKLLLTDDNIPITAYPLINLQFDISDDRVWENYLTELNKSDGISVDSLNHKIILNAEAKSVISYSINDSNFSLFQTKNSFNISNNSKDYLSLNIKPGLFISNTIYENDTLNPPGLMSSLKISIIQSLMEDMTYLDEMEDITFTISHDETNIDFVSAGKIQYKERNGHSIIESLVIAQNFIGTVGALLSE